MSRRVGDTFIVEPEKSQQCDDCGRVEELRPYGPGGSLVCFECAMKDPAGTEVRFEQHLDGVDLAASINATLRDMTHPRPGRLPQARGRAGRGRDDR